MITDNYYLDAHDVAKITKMSYSTGTRIIRELNGKLKKQGKLTLRGRIPRKFFYREVGLDE